MPPTLFGIVMNKDIETLVEAFSKAVATEDKEVGMEVAIKLMAGVLSDLRRIADAAERIANHIAPYT